MKPNLSVVTSVKVDRNYAQRSAAFQNKILYLRCIPCEPFKDIGRKRDAAHGFQVRSVNPERPRSFWRTKKRLYLLAECLVFLSVFRLGVAGQTSIVAIRTPDEIAVAADSLVTDEQGKPSPRPFCKIVALDKQMFFAASGVVDIGNSPYDLIKLAQNARKDALARGGGSFELTEFFINIDVIPAIDKALDSLKPDQRERVEERGRLFEYVLFGVVSDPWDALALSINSLPSIPSPGIQA